MQYISLKQLLLNYQPTNLEEQKSKKAMLIFLEAYPDCFDRNCKPGHFTASAWLLNQTGEKVLLLYHKKLQLWLQPGGHADGDSDLLQVALKEAQEESGIKHITSVMPEIFDIDIHVIPAHKNEPEHLHYDVRFLLQAINSEKLIANEESEALQWFSQDKMKLPTREPSVMRMFNKWLAINSAKNLLAQ